jgi:hypothetical protein
MCEAEWGVWHRIVEHGATHPGVSREDQVAQGFDEGPLIVDALVDGRLGQPTSAVDRFRPEPFDGVPHRPEVVGRCHQSELGPFRVSPLQLGLHEGGDVDVVEDEVANDPGDVHVDEHGVDDLQVAQVAGAKRCAAEVGVGELGTVERVGALVLCHRIIITRRSPRSRS